MTMAVLTSEAGLMANNTELVSPYSPTKRSSSKTLRLANAKNALTLNLPKLKKFKLH